MLHCDHLHSRSEDLADLHPSFRTSGLTFRTLRRVSCHSDTLNYGSKHLHTTLKPGGYIKSFARVDYGPNRYAQSLVSLCCRAKGAMYHRRTNATSEYINCNYNQPVLPCAAMRTLLPVSKISRRVSSCISRILVSLMRPCLKMRGISP